MSDVRTEAKHKRGGRRPWSSERAVRRALRAAKAEQVNRIVRMNPNGSIDLVSMVGEGNGIESRDTSWDDLKNNAQEQKRAP